MQQIRCKRFKVQNAAHAFQIRDFSSQMQENSKENCHRPENGNRARILWVKETDCSRFGKKKSHATIFVFEVSLHRHKTKIDSLDVVSVGFLLYPCVWILAHIPLQKV